VTNPGDVPSFVTLNLFQGSWRIIGGMRDVGVVPWMLNQVQYDGFGAGGGQ